MRCRRLLSGIFLGPPFHCLLSETISIGGWDLAKIGDQRGERGGEWSPLSSPLSGPGQRGHRPFLHSGIALFGHRAETNFHFFGCTLFGRHRPLGNHPKKTSRLFFYLQSVFFFFFSKNWDAGTVGEVPQLAQFINLPYMFLNIFDCLPKSNSFELKFPNRDPVFCFSMKIHIPTVFLALFNKKITK